jgi:Spy/CpxP family protein refolding chaperone
MTTASSTTSAPRVRAASRTLLALTLVGAAAFSSLQAEAAPAGGTPPAADGQGNNNGQNGQNGFMRRLIADNPELKDVDPNTPEGQEKIRAVMQARMEKMAPQIRQRMAEGQAANHAKLRETFAMSAEDFTAIEPLLTKVENLRLQQRFIVPQGGGGGGGGNRRGGFGGGPGGPGGMTPQMLLGDTPVEPSVQEYLDAAKALKALLDDAQSNAAEVDLAMARVRKAREAFQASLTKAQAELQAVLTHRQEAVLVERGILD